MDPWWMPCWIGGSSCTRSIRSNLTDCVIDSAWLAPKSSAPAVCRSGQFCPAAKCPVTDSGNALRPHDHHRVQRRGIRTQAALPQRIGPRPTPRSRRATHPGARSAQAWAKRSCSGGKQRLSLMRVEEAQRKTRRADLSLAGYRSAAGDLRREALGPPLCS
jgi:hypothetical protein